MTTTRTKAAPKRKSAKAAPKKEKAKAAPRKAKAKAAPKKQATTAPKRTRASANAAEGTADVDAFMAALQHPKKAEVAALRAIIRGASAKLAERVKWNAPSFHLGRYDMAAFQLRPRDHVMIVFVFPTGTIVDDPTGVLTGDYVDRRLAVFTDLADVRSKRAALRKIVVDWVQLVAG